jgi:hypothetical protein
MQTKYQTGSDNNNNNNNKIQRETNKQQLNRFKNKNSLCIDNKNNNTALNLVELSLVNIYSSRLKIYFKKKSDK